MKKRTTVSGRTKSLTLTAMLCALSVAMLYIGVLLDVLEISAVAITSLFMLFCLRELGRSHAFMLYAATTFLSVVLLPRLEAGILYGLFGGLYPMIKCPMERHRRPLPLLLKLVYLNAVITAMELLTVYVLSLPFEGWPILLLLYAIANPTFLLFDRLLDRLLVLYEVRVRPRIARFLT